MNSYYHNKKLEKLRGYLEEYKEELNNLEEQSRSKIREEYTEKLEQISKARNSLSKERSAFVEEVVKKEKQQIVERYETQKIASDQKIENFKTIVTVNDLVNKQKIENIQTISTAKEIANQQERRNKEQEKNNQIFASSMKEKIARVLGLTREVNKSVVFDRKELGFRMEKFKSHIADEEQFLDNKSLSFKGMQKVIADEMTEVSYYQNDRLKEFEDEIKSKIVKAERIGNNKAQIMITGAHVKLESVRSEHKDLLKTIDNKRRELQWVEAEKDDIKEWRRERESLGAALRDFFLLKWQR